MDYKVVLIGNGYWSKVFQKYIPNLFTLLYTVGSKFDKDIIWNDPSVDGVIIATPVDTHYDIAYKALLSGKHVLVEKPITKDSNEAEKLKSISGLTGKQVLVDYQYRESKSLALLKSEIHNIGDIEYFDIVDKRYGRVKEDCDIFWSLASHHLSILDMFFDISKVKFIFEDYLYLDNTCVAGSVLFGHGKIDVSLVSPIREFHVDIYGSNGMARYDVLNSPSIPIIQYDKKYRTLDTDLERKISTYHYDESNNVNYVLQKFKSLLEGQNTSNIDTAIKITRILENRNSISII
jgi:predicted dehydrogenase